jgi:ABC-2 type transport system permease protein
MKALYQKELQQYFTSMTGYIYLAIFLGISGIIFTTGNLLSNNGDIKVFFSSLFSVLIFILPILTMRLFSEEKKLKTLQLLYTMPVSAAEIVLAKFFAALTIFALGILVTTVYPLILSLFGTVELLVTLGSYCGITLLASLAIAIGLTVSVMTENQIVAAAVSYSILLVLWLADSISSYLSVPLLPQLLKALSLRQNFSEFTLGIFNPARVIFFISCSAYLLYVSSLMVEHRRGA